MDAVYTLPAGGWEIVDFKSGKLHPADEVRRWMQLPVYALAAHEIWGKGASDLTCTYFFLQSGTEITSSITDSMLREARARVEERIRSIQMRKYSALPGCRCRVCRWIGE
jgi:PD-(D/E)XK nuclease superfamily